MSTCYWKLAIADRRYGRSGELGTELCYRGFYRRYAVVASHRDSMVAVRHEEAMADLVEFDRRQVLAPLERPIYALPPLPHAGPRWQEGSVEVPPPPHAADDLIHLYDPRSPVEPFVSNGMLSSDLLE